MRCKKCNARLADHDIWCVACGTQSSVVKTDLSAISSLKQSYQKLTGHFSDSVPIASMATLLGIIPIAVIIFILSSVISLENGSDAQYLINLLIKSVLFSLFSPMALIPFAYVVSQNGHSMKLEGIAAYFKYYPKYLGFSLINAGYFALIHLICFGLPSFASDPILRLVWIVLLNYWLAIVLPVPILMEANGLSPLRAIRMSYKHFHDLRWNIYLLALVLAALNALAFSLAVFPLLFTLPLSYLAVRDYTMKLLEYELLDYRIS